MKVIVGIGNIGKKYLLTKHNIGFIVLDIFSEKHKLSYYQEKINYLYTGSVFDTSSFLLVKPKTFVNRTGLAIKDLMFEYNITPEDVLVIVDDLNLPMGKIRIRNNGGDGGHNGLKSIINTLESKNFPRIRFGIGNNFEDGEMADYVLSNFSDKNLEEINPNIKFTIDLIESFIKGGYKNMINLYSKSNLSTN